MASIYKRGRDDGKKKSVWWVSYVDANGKRRTEKGYVDKGLTQQLAAKLESDAQQRRQGLIGPFHDHYAKPLADHLADWRKTLDGSGITAAQVALVVGRATRLLKSAGFERIPDITMSGVQMYLGRLREKNKSQQTINFYLGAVRQFVRWLIQDRRMGIDPVAALKAGNVEADRRRERRALSAPETARLLDAAFHGPVLRGLPGPDRSMLYAVAMGCGLRASECASLSPGSFDFTMATPTVTVIAMESKRRRVDVLPVPSGLVEQLRKWIAFKSPTQPLWPGKWAEQKHAGWFLQRDLAMAKIDYVDAHGRYADFHALRHTFITNLALAGVPLAIAQRLARHSDPKLTATRYTQLGIVDLAGAANLLDVGSALSAAWQQIGSVGGVAVRQGESATVAKTMESSQETKNARKRNSRRSA